VHAGATYGPGRGEVAIDYGAVCLVPSHRVRFRHRLLGLETDWVDAGLRRQAYYGALPAGQYRFEVMASDADGGWTGAPVALELTLQPPFVKTPLFYALGAAAVALLVVGGHRVRVRQMRARFDAVLAERTRIARELHDTLGQAVAGIGLQIETGLRMLDRKPETARSDLKRAHAMARASLDEVRRSIWVLRAQTSGERDDLASTLERSLQQLTEGSGVTAHFAVRGHPRPLAIAVERNLLRVAHEAVTNALRHARAQHVSVELDFAGDGILLRVRDDGCGFDFQAHLAASGREHFGLLGLVERARILGGELGVASGPERGTELTCRIPYAARADAEESDGDAPER
jgi:signal transduction histidine kinase